MSDSKVYVVDDDESFLRAVSRLLRLSGFQVVNYNSATEFLSQLEPAAVGCVVADLQMPGMDGMALQAALQQTDNPLPVIFLTGRGDIPSSVRAMRQGAEDFLTKDAPKEDLIGAVQRALARDAQERAQRARSATLRQRFELLSARELEVLKHVMRGRLNKQIANDLGIHERTVKLHRTAITTKLGVHSVAELTKLWMEAGVSGKDTPNLSVLCRERP